MKETWLSTGPSAFKLPSPTGTRAKLIPAGARLYPSRRIQHVCLNAFMTEMPESPRGTRIRCARGWGEVRGILASWHPFFCIDPHPIRLEIAATPTVIRKR